MLCQLVSRSLPTTMSKIFPSTYAPILLPPPLLKLPSLRNVISETLRIHSTSSLGLPRLVPPGSGVTILGHHFPPGTALSVPAYTIHHSRDMWGADADDFRPERWECGELTEKQKAAFIPFSYGPRACVGRNVAEMGTSNQKFSVCGMLTYI